MDEERELVERWATCLALGCGNHLACIHILTYAGGDVECGVCGQPITDINDIRPIEGTVLPEWILEQLATRNSGN